jgi:lipid-binding SYLF domain-containing protein
MNSKPEESMRLQKCFLIVVAFIFLTGLFGDDPTPEEQRKDIQKMRTETLAKLYEYDPQAKGVIQKAAGYAVFSNFGMNLFVVSTANGVGVAHDKATGKDTYMKMFSGGVGVGLGVKDFRGIFVFSNKQAFEDFTNKGWQAGGQADAAAKAGEEGGESLGHALDVGPGVKLYQITENGLALQATVQGTKYSKDDDLN